MDVILVVLITVLDGVWLVISTIWFGLIWLLVAFCALLGMAAIAASVWGQRGAVDGEELPLSADDALVDAIKAALRSGDLDADIARVNARNAGRLSHE